MKRTRDAQELSEAEIHAADWFVRHDLGLVTDRDAVEFRTWLADPRNADAYAMFRDGWAGFEELSAAVQYRIVRGLVSDKVCAGWAPPAMGRRVPWSRVAADKVIRWLLPRRSPGRVLR